MVSMQNMADVSRQLSRRETARETWEHESTHHPLRKNWSTQTAGSFGTVSLKQNNEVGPYHSSIRASNSSCYPFSLIPLRMVSLGHHTHMQQFGNSFSVVICSISLCHLLFRPASPLFFVPDHPGSVSSYQTPSWTQLFFSPLCLSLLISTHALSYPVRFPLFCLSPLYIKQPCSASVFACVRWILTVSQYLTFSSSVSLFSFFLSMSFCPLNSSSSASPRSPYWCRSIQNGISTHQWRLLTR